MFRREFKGQQPKLDFAADIKIDTPFSIAVARGIV
jgi:hypothetical protein